MCTDYFWNTWYWLQAMNVYIQKRRVSIKTKDFLFNYFGLHLRKILIFNIIIHTLFKVQIIVLKAWQCCLVFSLISDQMSLVHYPLTGALMIGPDYFVILTSMPLVHQMVKWKQFLPIHVSALSVLLFISVLICCAL